MLLVIITCGALTADLAGTEINPIAWPWLAGLTTITLGVPHRGFDVALAKRRSQLDTPARLIPFVEVYMAIAAFIASLWFVLPSLALPLFLAMAAYHFSGDWGDELHQLPRLAIGATLICAPAILRRDQVIQIFS